MTPLRSRFRVRFFLFASAIMVVSASGAAEESTTESDRPWQLDPRFDPAFAEVARYEGEMILDGRTVEVPLEIVTRVVRLWPDTLTEAAGERAGDRTIEALKTTSNRVVPGTAGKREQVQSYLTRENLDPLRLTVTTIDWHATTYATWTAPTGRLRFFSEEWPTGEGEHLLSAGERMVFVDDLPSRLRGLSRVREGRWEVDLVESLLRADLPPPRVVPAMVMVGGVEVVEVPAGRFSVRRVTLTRHAPDGARRVDTMLFDRNAPHRLVRWEQADGHSFGLAAVERISAAAIQGRASSLHPAPEPTVSEPAVAPGDTPEAMEPETEPTAPSKEIQSEEPTRAPQP